MPGQAEGRRCWPSRLISCRNGSSSAGRRPRWSHSGVRQARHKAVASGSRHLAALAAARAARRAGAVSSRPAVPGRAQGLARPAAGAACTGARGRSPDGRHQRGQTTRGRHRGRAQTARPPRLERQAMGQAWLRQSSRNRAPALDGAAGAQAANALAVAPGQQLAAGDKGFPWFSSLFAQSWHALGPLPNEICSCLDQEHNQLACHFVLTLQEFARPWPAPSGVPPDLSAAGLGGASDANQIRSVHPAA